MFRPTTRGYIETRFLKWQSLVSCQVFPDLPFLYSTKISLIPQMADDFLAYIPSSDLSTEPLLWTEWPHPDVQWILQINMLNTTLSPTDFHQLSYLAFFLHSLSSVYRITTHIVPKPEVWEHISLSFFLASSISCILNLTPLSCCLWKRLLMLLPSASAPTSFHTCNTEGLLWNSPGDISKMQTWPRHSQVEIFKSLSSK